MIFSFPQPKKHEKQVLQSNFLKNYSYVKDTNKLNFICQSEKPFFYILTNTSYFHDPHFLLSKPFWKLETKA